MAGLKLIVADMVVSFLWVLSGALLRVVTAIVASHSLQLKENEEILKWALAVAVMFIFTWLGKITNGASYNPVTVLSNAFEATKAESLFTLAARIPAQAFGALLGVKCVNHMIQHGGQGPLLKVGLISGMAVEGILTFLIVMVSLIVRTRGPKSFFLKTWIMSITKLSLSILGARLTKLRADSHRPFQNRNSRSRNGTAFRISACAGRDFDRSPSIGEGSILCHEVFAHWLGCSQGFHYQALHQRTL